MRKEPALSAESASGIQTNEWKEAVELVPGYQSQHRNPVSQVAVMVRANEKWVAAGMPKGDGSRFWSEAELELQREAEHMLKRSHH